MEALQLATAWAKAEVEGSIFFIVFGVLFLFASIGFWRFGKSKIARSYRVPMLIASILLLVIGIGLVDLFSSGIEGLSAAYEKDPDGFVNREIVRTAGGIAEYEMAIFKVIPIIIVIASLLIVFVKRPIWRAIGISTIALMIVVILIDSNANARLKAYRNSMIELGTTAGD